MGMGEWCRAQGARHKASAKQQREESAVLQPCTLSLKPYAFYHLVAGNRKSVT